ncbi:poly(hydroxyalkanoate) depolymerase family esterase [Amorphus suaedae]
MKPDFATAMRWATQATRAGDPSAATRILQEALTGRAPAGGGAATPAPETADGFAGRTLDLKANAPRSASEAPGVASAPADAPQSSPKAATEPDRRTAPQGEASERARMPLGDVVRLLSRARKSGPHPLPNVPGRRGGASRAEVPVSEGAQFAARSFSCPAGARQYKLYRPASAAERPRALIVMLHGCQQDPDDFAVGTGMNAVAEAEGVLVAYPGQPGSANASSCWNWFQPGHQARNAGEPAIIAGITRELMDEFGLGRDQVFVAGLSAGAAMAVVMGQTYPDLFAAVGAHSGLPYRAANDVISAFAAMRGQAADRGRSPTETGNFRDPTRTIVFHGSADSTVHPSNGEMIAAAVREAGEPSTSHGRSPGGRAYRRSVATGAGGVPVLEHWIVEGAGHAWAGGSAAGSFTDPKGPDASREMMRFFLAERAQA